MPSSQSKFVGFELAKWDYVGAQGEEYLYRYSFNGRSLGIVTCKPEA